MRASRFLRFPPSASRCALSLLAGLLLCVIAPAAPAAYRVQLDAPDTLRDLLAAHLDLIRYQEREDLNEDMFRFMLDTAAEQVARLAATEGYFTPHTRVSMSDESGATVVHVEVQAGARTVVSGAEVTISGAAREQSPALAERLRRTWPLKPGAPFRQEDWAEAKQHGLELLQRRRHPAARISSSQARIDPASGQAALAVDYDSGPPFAFGPLRITGTSRYPDSIIDNV
ncbi:MAG TPA: outer membrane protein assembly factor, partial [Noviherbaspirillum sp.]|nr:outer membrane protein assembly factor [Noviherbaspirillum sp.]